MGQNIFDQDGKLVGRSEDDNPIGAIIIFGVAILIVYLAVQWIWENLTGWQSHEEPFNYVALFYYSIINYPIKLISITYEWLSELSLTDYKNLNKLISVSVPGILCLLVFWSIFKIIYFEGRFAYIKIILLAILVGPLILALGWFVLGEIFSWIFRV